MSVRFVNQAELAESEYAREMVGDDYGLMPASVIFIAAQPGEGSRLHKHGYTELFFVVEGQATFRDCTDQRVVRAGEAVIVSPDQPHAFFISGTGLLRQIDIHLSPASPRSGWSSTQRHPGRGAASQPRPTTP